MSWKRNLAKFFPLRKAWVYLHMRLFTVTLLWCAAGGALKAISWLVESLSDGPHAPLKTLSLGVFSDYRLIVILGVGVLALAGGLSIFLMNITPNKNDQERVIDFLARLWDEVSSASTHAGAVLFCAQMFFPKEAWGDNAPPGERWIVICFYLLIGYFAYRDDSKSPPAAPAQPQLPPLPVAQPQSAAPTPQAPKPGTP